MADYYRIHVSLYADFHELFINTIIEEVTDYDFPGLDNNTSYYWRVKRVNNLTGNESDWSSTCWFKTIPEDTIIQQTSAVNIIVYELGQNEIWPPNCLLNDGQLDTLLCLSGTYDSELNSLLCKCKTLVNRDE